MTDNPSPTPAAGAGAAVSPRRMALGALISVVAHLAVFGLGVITNVATFLVFEGLLAVGVIVATFVNVRRGRQDFAVGLLGAWAIGSALLAVITAFAGQ